MNRFHFTSQNLNILLSSSCHFAFYDSPSRFARCRVVSSLLSERGCGRSKPIPSYAPIPARSLAPQLRRAICPSIGQPENLSLQPPPSELNKYPCTPINTLVSSWYFSHPICPLDLLTGSSVVASWILVRDQVSSVLLLLSMHVFSINLQRSRRFAEKIKLDSRPSRRRHHCKMRTRMISMPYKKHTSRQCVCGWAAGPIVDARSVFHPIRVPILDNTFIYSI